ncbi:site-specific integrase [Caulobacter sp. FWC2]|uniref:tyrosine-type recombinase/integrase n=1 Tax=Caulobacter sp. FWC2 TaxID=69664 RepID=UPI001303F477|nr:site-specific integrase [Caulobacter sp. FWC2]
MKAPIKDQEEVTKLLDFAERMERPAMYRFLLALSFDYGLRPMELAGLDSSWFRTTELRIPIGHSKRKSGRSLTIEPSIHEMLAAHMQGRTGRVFLNVQGNPFTPRGISDAFQRLYRLADIEGSCYSGRRSLATKMVDRGDSIFIIQKVLGHAHVNTTMEYVSVTDNMMRRALRGAAFIG